MTFSKSSFFVVASIIAILSGCSTPQFENSDSRYTQEFFYPVQQMSLHEIMPESPEVTPELLTSEELVYSMSENENLGKYEQVENLEASNNESLSNELSSSGIDVLPASVAGVWNLSVNSKKCRVATPQTKFGQGYRAAPLNCSGAISRVKSWNVKGKKLYFYDGSGRVIVTFSSFHLDRFEGYTLDNKAVVLSR